MNIPVKIPDKITTPIKSGISLPQPQKTDSSFKSVYDAVFSGQKIATGLNPDVPLSQIAKVKEILKNSRNTKPADLLLYQIQISELNMRVELLSKAADSAVAVTRKLQNAQ